MQLRKLQRLLSEIEKDHGKYIDICIDTKFAASFSEYDFLSLKDVNIKNCTWEREQFPDRECQRNVVVLGQY